VDVGAIVAIGVISAFTAGWTILFPNRTRRVQRALASRERSWINLAHGAVKLTGRVRRARETWEAPLSGRECVAYELVVMTPVTAGGNGRFWETLVELREGCSFLVVDDSGTARIDTSGPYELALTPACTGKTKGIYPGKHRALGELLESRGIRPTTWLGRWRAIHYTESVLEPGMLVSVGGVGEWEADPDGERDSLRSMPKRLVLCGTESQPLLIGAAKGEPAAPR
jgi:hypothetical protein